MVKQSQQVQGTSADLIKELFKELITINRDINSLRARLESGLSDDHQILTNHRFLMQAIVLRNEIMQMLEQEYNEPITLEKLMSGSIT